jgi:hypothetical protein
LKDLIHLLLSTHFASLLGMERIHEHSTTPPQGQENPPTSQQAQVSFQINGYFYRPAVLPRAPGPTYRIGHFFNLFININIQL